MSFEYKNPNSSVILSGPNSVGIDSNTGTNFSIYQVGGFCEVFSLDDLKFNIPSGLTGTNSSGFNAYYAGEYRNPTYGRFNEHAQFWTLQDTIYLLLANWLGGFAVNSSPITYGMSVRCLKN